MRGWVGEQVVGRRGAHLTIQPVQNARGALPSLALALIRVQISGQFPSVFLRAPSLRILDLRWNLLSGPLSNINFALARQLVELRLSFNDFSGGPWRARDRRTPPTMSVHTPH